MKYLFGSRIVTSPLRTACRLHLFSGLRWEGRNCKRCVRVLDIALSHHPVCCMHFIELSFNLAMLYILYILYKWAILYLVKVLKRLPTYDKNRVSRLTFCILLKFIVGCLLKRCESVPSKWQVPVSCSTGEGGAEEKKGQNALTRRYLDLTIVSCMWFQHCVYRGHLFPHLKHLVRLGV